MHVLVTQKESLISLHSFYYIQSLSLSAFRLFSSNACSIFHAQFNSNSNWMMNVREKKLIKYIYKSQYNNISQTLFTLSKCNIMREWNVRMSVSTHFVSPKILKGEQKEEEENCNNNNNSDFFDLISSFILCTSVHSSIPPRQTYALLRRLYDVSVNVVCCQPPFDIRWMNWHHHQACCCFNISKLSHSIGTQYKQCSQHTAVNGVFAVWYHHFIRHSLYSPSLNKIDNRTTHYILFTFGFFFFFFFLGCL